MHITVTMSLVGFLYVCDERSFVVHSTHNIMIDEHDSVRDDKSSVDDFNDLRLPLYFG